MSIINEHLNQQKQIQAQIDALSFEEEQKAQREKNKVNMKADIDTYSAGMDSQIANTQSYYDKQIGDKKIEYESQYERNAVQKLINEKQIAERNANLGLTDSGLNRTQQTAAQLSYANQKGKIDLARQSALDNLSLAMTDAITTLQNQKASGIRDIENNWNSYSDEQAQKIYNTKISGYVDQYNSIGEQVADMYKADADADAKVQAAAIEANTELQKAQIAAAAGAKVPQVSYGAGGTSDGNYILKISGGLLSRDFKGSLKDNNVNVIYNNDGTTTYVDNNSGKKTTLASDINPYTGTRNKDVLDEDGYYDPSKAFDNGYQPNNVRGEKLKKVKDAVVSVKGNNQSVWYANGVYYVWDGANNKYQQLTRKQVYDLGI